MHVAIPKDDFTLSNEARAIAEIIAHTQVDQRADLLNRIAYHLKTRYSQGFTGGLFEKIASVS